MKAPAGTHLLRCGMADALASGASVRKDVGVQVPLNKCLAIFRWIQGPYSPRLFKG